MDRTTAPGSVAGQYVNDDPQNEIQGTLLIAEDRNAIQEEIVNTIEFAGITPAAGDLEQLRQAIVIIRDAIAANTILTKLLTVDTDTSGLNANTLQSQDGSYYRNSSNQNAGTLADARLPSTATRSQIASGPAPLADLYKIASIASDNLVTAELLRIRVSDNNANASLRKTMTMLFATGYDIVSSVGYILCADMSSDSTLHPDGIYRDNVGYYLNFPSAFANRTVTVEKLGQTLTDDLVLVTPATATLSGGTRTKAIPSDGVDLTWRDASNLTFGTLADAVFPATLPAVSGANLTNVDAETFDGVDSANFLFGDDTTGTTNFAGISFDINSPPAGAKYLRVDANTVNSPIGGAGIVINIAHSSNGGIQLAIRASTAQLMYVRQKWVGTWGSWRSIYDSGNDSAIAYIPQSASGRGQWVVLTGTLNNAIALPSGGTWSYFAFRTDSFFSATSGIGYVHDHVAGVAAGGTTIGSGVTNHKWRGFAWRIAA